MALVTEHFNFGYGRKPEYYNTRHKSWNTCVLFPFPNVDLGITVVSVLQNTRGSTLGKERGTFETEQGCED